MQSDSVNERGGGGGGGGGGYAIPKACLYPSKEPEFSNNNHNRRHHHYQQIGAEVDDEVEANSGDVIVFAATNRIQDLDPAIVR